MAEPLPACDRVLLVQAELDGELDAAQAAELRAHRAGCAICQAAETELARTRALLRGEAPGPMPDAVRARVIARLAQAGAPMRPAPARYRWWHPTWQPVAGFGLGAACAAALALLLVAPAQQPLLDQVVAGHIRALQPGHLEDVVSTDQHTVKPWFDGRLDFAPPVKDLAADGFPLKGGRLDYVDGHAVAALVYQRDKHVIDLFVWPAPTAAETSPQASARQGYNVVRWSAGGMNLWAVSDVERAQLDNFAALWQRLP